MTPLRPHLDWLLKDLVDGAPGTRHVVVLTSDGLRMAQYGMDEGEADRLAAACAGLRSLPSAVADEGVDAGLMGQQMRDLVARIGDHLSAPPRTERAVAG